MTDNTQTTDQALKINANYDDKINTKEIDFAFRVKKDKVTNPETGEVKEVESTRPTIKLNLDIPTIAGVVAILEGSDKEQQALILEAIEGVIVARARSIVSDDEAVTSANFPYDKATWEAIAHAPKAERRGAGIAKEVWEEFGEDYVKVMGEALKGSKTPEQIDNHRKILLQKFSQHKTNHTVLKFLQEMLAIYMESSPQTAVNYSECVEFLVNKAESLLSVEDKDLLGNL